MASGEVSLIMLTQPQLHFPFYFIFLVSLCGQMSIIKGTELVKCRIMKMLNKALVRNKCWLLHKV